jgi:glycosyltransferase involved in cell wall biosynthesis
VPHDALPAILCGADVFVIGSHDEGSGYALIEALSCGLVPVVTDIPSFRALTGGGSVGALWTPGDAKAFARALLDVASRPLEPQRDAVTRHFEAELTWPAVGRRALGLYREVLETLGP